MLASACLKYVAIPKTIHIEYSHHWNASMLLFGLFLLLNAYRHWDSCYCRLVFCYFYQRSCSCQHPANTRTRCPCIVNACHSYWWSLRPVSHPAQVFPHCHFHHHHTLSSSSAPSKWLSYVLFLASDIDRIQRFSRTRRAQRHNHTFLVFKPRRFISPELLMSSQLPYIARV